MMATTMAPRASCPTKLSRNERNMTDRHRGTVPAPRGAGDSARRPYHAHSDQPPEKWPLEQAAPTDGHPPGPGYAPKSSESAGSAVAGAALQGERHPQLAEELVQIRKLTQERNFERLVERPVRMTRIDDVARGRFTRLVAAP